MTDLDQSQAKNSTNSLDKDLPLVVDLDGTLIKTDVLLEQILKFVKTQPFKLFVLLFKLIGLMLGFVKKADFKFWISDYAQINCEILPFNQDVLDLIKTHKLDGGEVALATATHISSAQKIFDYLGLFDKLFATSDDVNLYGKKKVMALREAYPNGFIYIGNSYSDLSVWQEATRSVIVSNDKKLIQKLNKISCDVVLFKTKHNSFKQLFKLIRPHQWVKNVLIFVPLFTAQVYFDAFSWLQSLLSFAAFSFLASANYIVNDAFDIESDRQHSSKKDRALASGSVGIFAAFIMFVALFFATFISLYFASNRLDLFLVLLGYFVLSSLYSFRLKQMLFVDIIALATLYTIRIVAGAVAIGSPMSHWIILFSIFIFLSLALLKRYVEVMQEKSQKSIGRAYVNEDKPVILTLSAVFSGLSIIVFALYIDSLEALKIYTHAKLLYVLLVLLIYWQSRLLFLTNRGLMHHDPIVFCIKDKTSWLIGFLFLIILLGAR